ncbi:MAG: hypothetical protein EXR47_01500 [Dehalococcoidia bacterium]|nr:hypothetical protein [Dehalococcoidia bacterium]
MNRAEPAPLLRTPLYEAHLAAGARMAPFGGWEMPIQYGGILAEARAARQPDLRWRAK